MTKAEFVGKMTEKTELKKVDAEKAVTAFLEIVTETLASGDKIAFTGFGSFEVTEREAREGRNPATGAAIQIPASKAPKFKPSTAAHTAIAMPCLRPPYHAAIATGMK